MSRVPPPGGPGRSPFGGGSLPGGNPRPPPPGQGYGGGPGYGAPQAGYGQRPPPSQQRYGEKPAGAPSGGRKVPLQVEKVADKTLQVKLIYSNV